MKCVLVATAAMLLSGCTLWQNYFGPTAQRLHYQCGGLPLTVVQDRQQRHIDLILDGEQHRLLAEAAQPGRLFGDERYRFRMVGDSATLQRDGRVIVRDCVLTGRSAVEAAR
ncbi:lysozyme inhibitor [Affinibrenneria salicis]|uniref:Lysozyme inhibitor n=1 Tax=Affinibrenneria salicis TaxID=2590031 RepID=A0A5J5G4Q0_9GAMM|nr:lysozyme inhibitor [Affinibrenneria salicis]KAA9002041.1 lysozyme inhibitor [Affinibrenneria salicis]